MGWKTASDGSMMPPFLLSLNTRLVQIMNKLCKRKVKMKLLFRIFSIQPPNFSNNNDHLLTLVTVMLGLLTGPHSVLEADRGRGLVMLKHIVGSESDLLDIDKYSDLKYNNLTTSWNHLLRISSFLYHLGKYCVSSF